jgi:hypothetical protein
VVLDAEVEAQTFECAEELLDRLLGPDEGEAVAMAFIPPDRDGEPGT